MFQHAAARRRLGRIRYRNYDCVVSTRSRPKAAELTEEELQSAPLFQHAAARRRLHRYRQARPRSHRFNTQPPEGG